MSPNSFRAADRVASLLAAGMTLQRSHGAIFTANILAQLQGDNDLAYRVLARVKLSATPGKRLYNPCAITKQQA
jgi:hypothetical protein